MAVLIIHSIFIIEIAVLTHPDEKCGISYRMYKTTSLINVHSHYLCPIVFDITYVQQS